MKQRAASSILKSKVKLGATASVAAGIVGREQTVATDAFLRADIISYSRARGLFAGVSVEGSTLRPDNRANRKLYGKDRKSTRLNSSHLGISYAVFCLKKKNKKETNK